MALTPEDPMLATDSPCCTFCGKAVPGNKRALTYHYMHEGGSLVMCFDCVSPVFGSMLMDVADWVSDSDFDPLKQHNRLRWGVLRNAAGTILRHLEEEGKHV